MSAESSTPSKIAGFQVLSISLPLQHSFRVDATHYLYVSPHQPRVPSATASRSLFLANVPFDSTQFHIKQLLSHQIGLPAGRIEAVHLIGRKDENDENFDEARAKQVQSLLRKRKRSSQGSSGTDFSGTELPSTWDRGLRLEGLTAVVLLVDRASRDSIIKAITAVQRSGKQPVWGDGVQDRMPALGYARKETH